MKKYLLHGCIVLMAAALAAPVCAQIYFMTYQKVVDYQQVNDSLLDSTVNFSPVQLGTSQLEISELTINPRGSYLDVVEDAYLTGNISQVNVPNTIGSYFFKGLVQLPQNAVATGLETWIGDTLYRAKLLEAKYIVDVKTPDSSAVASSLDRRVAMLQQMSATVYEATFAHASIGMRRHVRLRYLIPNPGNGNTPYAVPVVFNDPNGQNPQFIRLTVYANTTDKQYYLGTSTGQIQLRDSTSQLIPYQSQVMLTYLPKALSVMHFTSFADGAWAGNYLLLNTALTDSTMMRLSKPIQTVFLWRWNAPAQMIDYSTGIRGLSGYAQTVISQAKLIKQNVATLRERGYSCGLLHSIEGVSALPYATQAITDSGPAAINAYLSTFDEQSLYAKYLNEPDPTPVWVPTAGSSEPMIQKARDDFLSLLKAAARLLADTSVAYRHVVLVTVGDATTAYQEDLRESTDSILAHTSIDASTGGNSWRGVDLSASLPWVTSQNLSQWQGFYYPSFSPVTVQLKIKTSQQAYSFPLASLEPSNFAISARVSGVWDTIISWVGFDPSGHITSSFTTAPLIISVPQDSGVAKIWAHDDNHLAEKEEVYPGGTFGIVTKSTFLAASLADTTIDTSATIPFLSDNEILAPRSALRSKVFSAKHFQPVVAFSHGFLDISNAGELTRIEFFDISGRLLLRLDPAQFRMSDGNYRIPLARFSVLKAHRVLIIRMSGKTDVRTMRIMTGGLK
ncbi:MAG TPA: hypothetical protein VLX68_14305 [Chitinivibrionales bacterium]|nr:hypothetical protein [Chitinivibrionales bacterium]